MSSTDTRLCNLIQSQSGSFKLLATSVDFVCRLWNSMTNDNSECPFRMTYLNGYSKCRLCLYRSRMSTPNINFECRLWMLTPNADFECRFRIMIWMSALQEDSECQHAMSTPDGKFKCQPWMPTPNVDPESWLSISTPNVNTDYRHRKSIWNVGCKFRFWSSALNV